MGSSLLSKIKSFFWELFLYALGILFIIVFLTYTILFFPTFFIRLFAQNVSPFLHPTLSSILSSSGSMFAQSDDEGKAEKSVILGKMTFKGIMTEGPLRELLNRKMVRCKDEHGKLRYPELRQYITNWFGYKFWKWENPFCLEDHIYAVKEDINTQEDLEAFTNKLLTIPFKAQRSPWEFIIVPMEKEGETVGFFRAHHGLADGYSVLYMFRRAFGDSEETNTKPPITPRFTAINLKYFLSFPFCLLRVFGEFAYNTAAKNVWKQDEPLKSWTYHQATSNPISNDDIRKIRHKHKTSFAAVVYAIISGGIHRFLAEKQKDEKKPNIPSFPSAIPFPMKNHPDRLVNKFSFVLTEFPVDVKDSVKRLKIIHENIEGIRESPVPIIGYLVLLLHGLHINPIGKALNSFRYCPIAISYFPVGDLDWAPLGFPVLDLALYAKLHQGNIGAVLGVTGTQGKLRCTITANENLLPEKDLKKVCEFMEVEVQALLSS